MQLLQVPLLNDPLNETAPEYFIRISPDGKKFLNGCDVYNIAGANIWEAVDAAAGAPKTLAASIPEGLTGPEVVRQMLQTVADSGFNTIRIWAHTVTPQYAIMRGPGEFDEGALKGLDYVVDEARKRGLKVNLALASQWTSTGGVPDYLRMANLTNVEDFYTDPAAMDLYKSFAEAIITRTNTINGRVYSEDPTIFAWDLLNEPRCVCCPAGTVTNWYHEMAAFVKSLDTNHLVTTGEDGFYGDATNPANPGVGSSWASEEGQDFIADHDSPDIDFAVAHLWPDNWNQLDAEFQVNWIRQHAEDASTLGKPFLLQEWGRWLNLSADATLESRDATVNTVLDEVEAIMQEPDSGVVGSMFWELHVEGSEASAQEGGGRGLYGILPTDDAYARLEENAAFIQSLNGLPVDGECDTTTLQSVPPPEPCPSGLEGAACDVPVNECVRGLDNCDPNAACIDTPEGFECQCFLGFTGDGVTCTPNEGDAEELAAVYWSQPEGSTCDAGVDVEYPSGAPGWMYDPLNSFAWDYKSQIFNETLSTLGSRTNVTLEDCMVACQEAPECESFTINEVLQKCFLKSGQCPIGNWCYDPVPVQCLSTNDRGGSFSFDCGTWMTYYRLDTNTEAACADYIVGAPLDDPTVVETFDAFKAEGTNRFIRPTVAPADGPVVSADGPGR